MKTWNRSGSRSRSGKGCKRRPRSAGHTIGCTQSGRGVRWPFDRRVCATSNTVVVWFCLQRDIEAWQKAIHRAAQIEKKQTESWKYSNLKSPDTDNNPVRPIQYEPAAVVALHSGHELHLCTSFLPYPRGRRLFPEQRAFLLAWFGPNHL